MTFWPRVGHKVLCPKPKNWLANQVSVVVKPYVSGRGQLSCNLFFNDIPVTYNSSTADRFDSKYTSVTVGLRADF
jgi:hypothetical protein